MRSKRKSPRSLVGAGRRSFINPEATMSIFRRANSPCWYTSFRDHLTGKRVEVSTRTPLRREALKIAEKIEREWGEEPPPQPQTPPAVPKKVSQTLLPRTLQEAKEEYMAELARLGAAKQRINSVGSMLKNFLSKVDRFGQVAEVLTPQIRSFLQDLFERAMAPKTCISYLATISGLFAFCVRQKYTDINPARGIPMPRDRTIHPKRAFNREEWQALLAAPIERGHLLVYALGALSGLRRAEIARISHADFDLKRGLWTLRAEVQKVKIPVTIPFVPGTSHVLQELRFPIRPPDCAQFNRALAAAGVEKMVDGRILTFHSLRYTFITWLARAGVKIQIVQRMARHRTLHQTVQTYLDLGIGDLVDAIEAMPDLGLLADTPAVTEPQVSGPVFSF